MTKTRKLEKETVEYLELQRLSSVDIVFVNEDHKPIHLLQID